MGLPWKSSDWDTALPMQGPWVRSLVMELRSHMSCGKAKKKKVVIRESLALKISRNGALDSLYFLPFGLLANQPIIGVKVMHRSKIQRTKLPNTFLSLHRGISQALSSYSPWGEWDLPSRSVQNHWAEEGPVTFSGLVSSELLHSPMNELCQHQNSYVQALMPIWLYLDRTLRR